MKLTLLDMVQNILSAMDSDPANSIDDTVESLQVAEFVKEAYFELVSSRDWPFLRTLSSLDGLGDTDNYTKMRLPEGTQKVYWMKYNKKEVTYLPPKDFRDMLDNRVEQTDVVDANGYVINKDPEYWTSYDDEYVTFDGINLDEDSTLQESKSVVYALITPEWEHTDDFIPTLPEKMFPLLLAEAKAVSFSNLKQQANQKEELRARRGRNRFQTEATRLDAAEQKYNDLINYGRK